MVAVCGMDTDDVCWLPKGTEPPPKLATSTTCLYVLHIRRTGTMYVGETEALADRLKKHRRNHGPLDVAVIVIPMEKGGRYA